MAISSGSAEICEVWHSPFGRQYLSARLIWDIFHQLLPFVCPTGNSTCLNSITDFAKRTPNPQALHKSYEIHNIHPLWIQIRWKWGQLIFFFLLNHEVHKYNSSFQVFFKFLTMLTWDTRNVSTMSCLVIWINFNWCLNFVLINHCWSVRTFSVFQIQISTSEHNKLLSARAPSS